MSAQATEIIVIGHHTRQRGFTYTGTNASDHFGKRGSGIYLDRLKNVSG